MSAEAAVWLLVIGGFTLALSVGGWLVERLEGER